MVGVAAVVLVAAACSSDSSEDGTDSTSTTTTTQSSTSEEGDPVEEAFDQSALAGGIETVDCTLENGSETTCYRITAPSQPVTVETGPFCPTTVSDPDYGTFVWDGDEPGFYGLDEQFWEMVDGQGYSFAGADGTINVVDPGDTSQQPSGGDACLQATPDASYTLQVLLPVEPEMLDTPVELGTVSQVGIATDGVTIFGDAPSGAGGAIPALDHCGGHDDPSGYYHWHFGASSIQTNLDEAGIGVTCSVTQDDEALFGFAYDGFGIYGPLEGGEAPGDLDECSGHVSATASSGEVYHYHLTFDSPNLPTCRVGAVAEQKLTSPDNADVLLPDTGGTGGPGGAGGAPPGGAALPAPEQGTGLPGSAADGAELASAGQHCHTVDGSGRPVCH